MAHTKEKVQNFIENMRSQLKPIHDEEIRQLTTFAQSKAKKPNEYEKLQAWDVPYWRYRQSQELISSSKVDTAMISRHFVYDNVLQGLFRFVDELFGVQFQLDEQFDEEHKWHPDVRVYRCLENGN
jgi:Zn-dependent oligopeptidase